MYPRTIRQGRILQPPLRMQYNVHAFEIDINTQQSYLQCPKRCGLETVIKLTESLSYFSHEPLERESLDKKLRGFLVAADFSECDGTRAEAPSFPDTYSYLKKL